jgi:MFS superfamily sulfate permease-like transporter
MNLKKSSWFKFAGADIPASLVLFLITLPLCLGIALGSNAPLFSGIIAGIVGGIVVGLISGSQLSVSGPAAGLTFVVAMSISRLPNFEAFLLAVVIAGVFQIILGKLKAGFLGDFVPSSVIKGMMAAIGFILILKQFPHLVGYDKDFIGDETFLQNDGQNTFTEIINSIQYITPVALIIGFVALVLLILWELPVVKKNKYLSLTPSALFVITVAILINEYFVFYNPSLALAKEHLVQIPEVHSLTSFSHLFTFPDIQYLRLPEVWFSGVAIAIIASLETLLSLEASDKLDPYKRLSPPNRELVAQGIGNIVSGMIGGLPLTAVVVRSSVNINAGAKTKLSTILHGVFLVLSVAFLSFYINLIPLSALAAVLIYVGYKIANPKLFIELFKKGADHFVPFIITFVAILLSDLLPGIMIGILSGLFFTLKSNYKRAVFVAQDKHNYLLRFRSEVSFLNKSFVRNWLEEIPNGSFLFIDATKTNFIDGDIVEDIHDFMLHAPLKKIKVEFKQSSSAKNHFDEQIAQNQ